MVETSHGLDESKAMSSTLNSIEFPLTSVNVLNETEAIENDEDGDGVVKIEKNGSLADIRTISLSKTGQGSG
jgi:hypothetical protein